MAVNLSGKLNLDGTGYNDSIKSAVQETAKLKREVDSANKTMNSFQKGLSGASSSISSMMSSFKAGDIGGFVAGAKGAATAITSMIPAAGGATAAMTGLGTAIYTALGPVGLIVGGIAGIGAVIGSSISSVENFNKSLNGLSAITGVEGDALKDVGDMALDMSKKFGGAATDIVDSMSKIGGQAPVLLKDMDALGQVTEAAIVLSKAADNMTVEDTAKAITTVMNQFNVTGAESTNIINTLAAGSKEGAAEVDYLTVALEKAGTQASNAGMSYQQAIAAIETLAPKFSSAEVAGTGLSSMLIRLTTQTNSKFNPAIVGLDKALENLDKANLSAADKLKLFGAGSLTVAETLIKNKDALKDMTAAVSGTNTAYEQMNIKSQSLEVTWNKLTAAWDAFMIKMGQSKAIQAIINVLGLLLKAVTGLINGLGYLSEAVDTCVTVIIALFKKMWEAVKPYWDAMVNMVTNSAIYKAVTKIWQAIYDFIAKVINKIRKIWSGFMKELGIETKKVKEEISDTKPVKTDVNVNTNINNTSKTKSKIDYDKGSLEYYKKELQKLEDKLTKKKLSLIDVDKTKAEIEKVKAIIEKKEIELGIKAKDGSLEAIENEISKIDSKLKKLNPTIDAAEINDLQIKKDALKKLKKDVETTINGAVVTGKKFKTEGKAGSLQEAQDKVAYYQAKLNVITETDSDYQLLVNNLKEWKAKEQEIKLKVDADTSNVKEGTLKFFNDKINVLKSKLEVTAVGSPEYYDIVNQIRELSKQQDAISLKVDMDLKGIGVGSLAELDAKIHNLEGRLMLETYGTEEFYKIQKELKDLTKEEQKIKMKVEFDNLDELEKAQTILDGFHAIDNVVNSISSLSQAIEEDADAWTILMSTISTIESVFAAVNTVMEIANFLTNLGTASKTANATASVASGAAATEEAAMETATVAPKTAEIATNKALEASILDLAAAQIFLAHASIPFAGVGIAAGMITTMMAAMAAQHAASLALQAFAGGGIVKGSTTVGDNVLVRANKGEMVLNQRQQNNLFKAIDQNRMGTSGESGQVEFVIKGDKLYGVMKNYEKIHKK